LVADMTYLLADLNAAHTRPLPAPPLGHLDTAISGLLQFGQIRCIPHHIRRAALA